MRSRSFTAGPGAALLTAALLAAPAAGQEPGSSEGEAPVFARSYAIVAYDSAAGHLGVAAASTEFSVGSGGALLDPALGAVTVPGRPSGGAARRILDALRSGRSPAAAVAEGVRGTEAAQAAALTPSCDRAAEASAAAADEAESRPGRAGDVCYLAVGVRPRSAADLDALVRSFRSASGDLLARLTAALSAVESASRSVGGSRSAAVWVAAADGGDPILGRRELRVQVDDHGRPALAVEKRLEAGRADWLARRASRAVDRGGYERAAALADSSLALDQSAPMAWLQRGRALLHRGRVEEAETAFQRMLELDPYLLRLLGDASGTEISVRESVIPYYPRLVLRLDLYRREYFDDLDFGPEPEPFVSDSVG